MIHQLYLSCFGDDEKRDASYIEDVDNIEDTAMSLLQFQSEMLLLVERFRTSAKARTNEDLRVKRWSLLPLPTNGMGIYV